MRCFHSELQHLFILQNPKHVLSNQASELVRDRFHLPGLQMGDIYFRGNLQLDQLFTEQTWAEVFRNMRQGLVAIGKGCLDNQIA